MADEEKKKEAAEEGSAEAGEDGGEAQAPKQKMFSKKGIIIFVAIMVLEALGFGVVIFMGFADPAEAEGDATEAVAEEGESAGGEADDAPPPEVDGDALLGLNAHIMELGEITVYPGNTQSNAPRRITAEISVILTKELGEALQSDDKKETHKRLKINVRQALSRLLEDYGVRVLDKAGRVAYQREAKRMLNNVQIDDAELRKPLRVLRGHVLQVVIDRQEQSSL